MVSKSIFFAFAALCICQVLARPGGDKDNLEKLSGQMSNLLVTLSDEFKQVFDIKETAESKKIADTVKSTANDLAGKLTEVMDNINKEVKAHSGDAGKAVESLKAKVSETVKKLQEANPAEAAKAQEYQKQIETLYTDLATKAKETAQTIAKDTSGLQDDFHKFTENVLSEVKTNIEKMNTELKKSLEEHKKEHKH